MKISKTGLDLIKRFEKFSPTVYRCPAGLPTIGYGHVLKKHDPIDWIITEEFAQVLLDEDCDIAEKAINAVNADLNQHQFDALVSLVFNIGIGAFKISTCKKLLQVGEIDKIPDQFGRWIYVKGKVSMGLVKRRSAEKNLFIGKSLVAHA